MLLVHRLPVMGEGGELAMLLWLTVIVQMLAWAWFSVKSGKLSDRNFLIFSVGMLVGQLAAGIESYQLAAWRSFVIQVFFFIFTAFGGVQRYRQMK